MSSHFFFSAVRRLIVPAALAGATVLGTLGFSSVASAEERVAAPMHAEGMRGVGPRVGVRVGGPVVRPAYNPYWYPGYYGGYGVSVAPGWGGYGYRGGWGGRAPYGEYRGGGATFHGGAHGGGGGGFHGGGAHGGGAHGGGHGR